MKTSRLSKATSTFVFHIWIIYAKHWYEEVRDIVCFYKDNFYNEICICVQTLNNVDKEFCITFCTLEFYIFTIFNKISCHCCEADFSLPVGKSLRPELFLFAEHF
jgi:hypothetical protein